MPYEELSELSQCLVFDQTVTFEELDNDRRLNQSIDLIQWLLPSVWREANAVVLGKPLGWKRKAQFYLVLNTLYKGLGGTDEIVFAKAATEAAVCWLRDRLGAHSATIM